MSDPRSDPRLHMTGDQLRQAIMGDDDKNETPEWVVLGGEIRVLAQKMRSDVAAASARFRSLDDVQAAIAYRERHVPRLRDQVGQINKLIKRFNLIVPHARFQVAPLDVDEEVAPLARAYFKRESQAP